MSMSIEDIMRYLPHRYPFLLVDRVLEIGPGSQCRGLKNVSINEPFFQGHFPGLPVMPGVLIVEAIAQLGAAALLLSDSKYHGKVPLLGSIEKAKFRRKVVPGDQLMLISEIVWLRGTVGKVAGRAEVDGELAASAEIIFKIAESE